ncbi:cellulose synthase [Neorhizobium sp. T786]|uniref:cellulose synthase n=1 Tax=Pseudorhizobium xiangyangii TaxID=2883104 RepID=UPI001CFFDE9E|nr:cellulose synthase [Neorhizobium xiangyangii]MCB5203552.1 cellulose synthase [Neorhizobium xiangyangii]
MSVKLPLLLVSAAIAAGVVTTGPSLDRLDAYLKGTAGAAPSQQLALDDTQNADLDGVARDIRSMQALPPKTDRLAPDASIAPFMLSQADPAQRQQPAEDTVGGTAEQAPPPEVDESALRYFAAKGDTARLAAEIARLKSLYPNWTPPADPLAVPQNADRQLEAMWQLYSEGRYPEVRRAIVERQAQEAGWLPPADLVERLQVAEARSRLVNASNLKQYRTVIEVGAANSSLLNCSDVDVLWRVAEAFAQTERPQRAIDAYSYILTNCTNTAERVATMQKAASLLPYNRVQPLLALEKTADGVREFDSIRDDLARRFVAEANDAPTLDIAAEYVERVKQLALAEGPASDALLLGWYYLRRNDAAEAENWFRRAREREDSEPASQGFALTLLEHGKPAEAEAVLYRWRDSSDDATATYLAATANLLALDPAPVIADDVLTRMAQTVIAEQYAPSAQQFGWYARSFDQPQTAERWFETALQWAPEDEPSAYGLALTRQQLNDRAGFAQVQQQWAERSPRIAELAQTPRTTGTDNPAIRASASRVAAVQPGTSGGSPTSPRLPETVAPQAQATTVVTARRTSCSGRSNPARLSPAAALDNGWCLMDLNRPLEAAESFEVAMGSGDRRIEEDAAYGQSLAYLRIGLTDRAAVAAAKAPMNSSRARELQASILADRAIQSFGSDRYRETLLFLDQRTQVQQETVDLMVLRGYSYMNLKRPRDALRVFEAAAATGNRDAVRGLADARAAVGLN